MTMPPRLLLVTRNTSPALSTAPSRSMMFLLLLEKTATLSRCELPVALTATAGRPPMPRRSAPMALRSSARREIRLIRPVPATGVGAAPAARIS
ncbi:hypothetical protein D3C72_1289010 [compost metagenome]